MARILDITESFDQPRLKIYFQMESEKIAEWYAASYLMSVREKWRLLDLYSKENFLILDGPVNCHEDEQCIRTIAKLLKDGIENDKRFQ